MSTKKLPPPRGGDLSDVLRGRHEPAVAEPAARKAPAPAPRPRSVPMVRRSWYIPADTADSLQKAVEDLHYAARKPKHEALAALLATIDPAAARKALEG